MSQHQTLASGGILRLSLGRSIPQRAPLNRFRVKSLLHKSKHENGCERGLNRRQIVSAAGRDQTATPNPAGGRAGMRAAALAI
jgi:hypothetical protein